MADFLKGKKWKLVVFGILFCICAILYSYFIADTVTTRITDAQMVKVDGRYMVATEKAPYVNEDIWYRFKFDSGSVQNDAIRLKGKEVRIKKYGWRIPVLSQYENIVSIDEVKK